MTILPVPRRSLAVESDAHETGAGRSVASRSVLHFGRALQSDRADTFDANAVSVPIDSAAVFAAGACMGARQRAVSARVGRLAAPARG